MSVFIALLRGVNVAGRRKVAMADLVALAEDLGFAAPRTLLQSGNLVFTATGGAAALEARLEAAAAKALGLSTPFMVRSAKDWLAAVAANPFRAAAARDPGHLVLLALKDAPPKAAVAALRAAVKGAEEVAVVGKNLYAVYPDGIGRSKLTNAVIERSLATAATGRNWNTVLKLAALAGA